LKSYPPQANEGVYFSSRTIRRKWTLTRSGTQSHRSVTGQYIWRNCARVSRHHRKHESLTSRKGDPDESQEVQPVCDLPSRPAPHHTPHQANVWTTPWV